MCTRFLPNFHDSLQEEEHEVHGRTAGVCAVRQHGVVTLEHFGRPRELAEGDRTPASSAWPPLRALVVGCWPTTLATSPTSCGTAWWGGCELEWHPDAKAGGPGKE